MVFLLPSLIKKVNTAFLRVNECIQGNVKKKQETVLKAHNSLNKVS